MLDQALLTAALTLTLNLSNDPCNPFKPITITYNEEVYETFPANQGGQVLQVVEGYTVSERFVVIIKEQNVLSFMQRENVTGSLRYVPWLRGQLNGTVQALQSDNNFQLIRPAYCDLPIYNANAYHF
jgi:hypothetical protein